MLHIILGIIVSLIVVSIAGIQWYLNYWQRRGLICREPTFFFGNTKDMFLQKETFGEFTNGLYRYFRSKKTVHGGYYFMWSPSYMPIDPELIKQIMQNDFGHFVDRGMHVDEKADPLSAHLFSLEGEKWRTLRSKLTPTFTSGKMKMMFETLNKCSEQLTVLLDQEVGKEPVDIKNVLVRFTTDIIGNCAFGIECNSLKEPKNEFVENTKLFFEESFIRNMIAIIVFTAPRGFSKFFRFKPIDSRLSKFFTRIVRETMEYREKNNVQRKDFMHLLLQLKNRGKLVENGGVLREDHDGESKISFTFNEMAAQSFIFFLAGFETSSTTMTFCLFELASNPEIQEKVREEINRVLSEHDNKITYDAIMQMNYMEKVINETLRKYPPLPLLNRICTKDYHVPGTDLVLEKGTKVSIPVMGIQHDPEYYENPEVFDPERFSDENKKKRHPYTFLPFGEGPRICIGLRFGMMQAKVGLCTLLRSYRFSVNEKTQRPLKFDAKSFILVTQGGIWLDYEAVQ